MKPVKRLLSQVNEWEIVVSNAVSLLSSTRIHDPSRALLSPSPAHPQRCVEMSQRRSTARQDKRMNTSQWQEAALLEVHRPNLGKIKVDVNIHLSVSLENPYATSSETYLRHQKKRIPRSNIHKIINIKRSLRNIHSAIPKQSYTQNDIHEQPGGIEAHHKKQLKKLEPLDGWSKFHTMCPDSWKPGAVAKDTKNQPQDA